MSRPTSIRRGRSSLSDQRPDAGGPQKGRRREESDPFPELFAGDRRRGFAVLIVAGLGQGAALAGMTLLMKAALDRALMGAEAPGSQPAGVLLGALAACAGAAGLLKWLTHVEAERIGQSYAHALRMRLFRRLVAAGAQPKGERGAVLLRLSGDLTPLRQWVSRGISQLLVGGISITLALAALASIDWRIAAVVAITIGAAAAVSIPLGDRLGDTTADARRQRGKLADRASATIDDAPPASEREAEREARRRLRRASRGVRDALLDRALYAGALRAIAESAGAFAGVAAIIVGAGLTARGALSPGSVMSAVFIAGALAPHAHAMSRAFEYWTAAKVARKKQVELFERLSPERK